MRNRQKVFYVIIFIVIILIFISALFFYYHKKSKTEITAIPSKGETLNTTDSPQETGIYYYYNFPFPYELSEEEVNGSLMEKKSIFVDKTIDINWIDKATKLAEEKGWKVVEDSKYNDGGSIKIGYLKDKKKPAVEIFYEWNMIKGEFESMTISFIHPADIDSWLSKIKEDNY